MKCKIIKQMVFLLSTLIIIGCSNSGINNVPKKIAILKYATHPALDELENGYVQKLEGIIRSDERLKGYVIEKFNANGSPQTAKTIADSFNKQDTALVLAIGTPAAIAVSKSNSDITFLYGAVADPQGAGIIPSNKGTGIQNAGETIIRDALTFIKQAFPEAKKIGTIYNPSEQNSVFVQGFIESQSRDLGYELKQISINGTSQLGGITESLCNDVDIIYSANDNTVNAGIATIVDIANKKKKPLIIGDLSTLSKGPLFAIGLEYKPMGEKLADISSQLLTGKTILDFPPEAPPQSEIWINAKTEKEINYKIPNQKVTEMIKKRID